MKLFFKHLINSIKAKPLQPIILILTLFLSMIVNVSVFCLRGYLDEEMLYTQKAQYGRADVTVSLNGTSQSRFMFTKDVRALLGDKACVAGCYELPLAVGEEQKTAFGVAVNFAEVGNVFDFAFSEYSEISKNQINNVALVSRSFAEERGLTLGETFTVKALGYDKTYSVAGISETRFLASYDVMVNITGVMRLLAADSLFVSALGDSFQPCSTIYLDLKDGFLPQECIDLLKTEDNFSEKSFSVVADVVDSWMSVGIADVTTNLILGLAGALSATIVFCCFYILSAQRTEENVAFKVAGAKPWRLAFWQYAEIVLYWFVGAVLGVLCVVPMLQAVVSHTEFQFVVPRLEIINAIKGGLLLLVEALLTTTAFLLFEKVRKKSKQRKIEVKTVSGILLVILIFLFPGIFLVPIAWRLVWSLACGVVLLVAMFVCTPVLFCWAMKKLDAYKHSAHSASFHYAVKNVCSVKVLHNTCRLTALIVMIIACILLSVSGVKGYESNYQRFLKGDLIVANASSSCLQKVEECESVEKVYSVYFGAALHDGESVQILSVSDIDAVSDFIAPSKLPVKNEVIISEVYANMRGVQVGDPIVVDIAEKAYSFTVSEITKSGLPIIFFNSEYLGLPYNMLSVEGKKDVSDSMLRQALTKATALELAAVLSISELMQNRLQIVNITLNCADFMIPFVLIFALLGLFDNLVESYRARREEFGLYESCGMTKKQIVQMKVFELGIVFLFGAAIAFLSFGMGAVILNQALQSVGFGLFINF